MIQVISRIWSRLKRFVRFLSETFRTLAAVLAIVGAIGFGTAVAGLFSSNIALILVGTTFVILSVVVAIILYSTAEGLFTHSEFGRSNVKVILKRVYYRYYTDNQTMEHGKYYKIIALQNGVTQFIDRFRWTGHGRIGVHLLTSNGQKLDQEKSEYWHLNKILFDTPMKRGEVKEIALRWDLFDEAKEAVPFLSQPADYPTDRMSLRVTLPTKPKEIIFTHFSDYLALDMDVDRIVEKRLGEYDSINGEITYDIPKPQWGHKYKISWVP